MYIWRPIFKWRSGKKDGAWVGEKIGKVAGVEADCDFCSTGSSMQDRCESSKGILTWGESWISRKPTKVNSVKWKQGSKRKWTGDHWKATFKNFLGFAMWHSVNHLIFLCLSLLTCKSVLYELVSFCSYLYSRVQDFCS